MVRAEAGMPNARVLLRHIHYGIIRKGEGHRAVGIMTKTHLLEVRTLENNQEEGAQA